MPSPKKNVAFDFNVSLVSASTGNSFQANPTLAIGDVKVSIDNAALANITTLPTVSPASSRIVRVSLSQAEMNGDRIAVQFVDAAGAEWQECMIEIITDDVTINDLVRSTTPANTLDVSATGEAGVDWANVGGKTTTNALTGTTIAATQQVDVNTIKTQTVTCAAGVTVNVNVGTTQPLNFTGTAGSALVKSDMVDVAGAAVSTSTAQLGVNVVNFGGSAGTFSSGKPAVTVASTDVTGNVAADLQTIKTQTVTCAGGVTVPAATLASTTNITAGTITTVTNLTNAPTVGDFTSTMKTSLNAATPASIQNVDNVWSVATRVLTAGTNIQLPSNGLANVTAWTVALTGNITGNLSGSVGSVTGNVGGMTAAGLALFFTTDTTKVFADAIAGSVVKETAIGSASGGSTPAQIATAVWQDATAGDFTVASSIGKSLYTAGVVPGGSGGLLISGSNAGTTTLAALTVTGAMTATNAGNDVRGVKLAATGLAAVTAWTVDITGTLSTVTNLTNAPTSGDFTAAMKTSLDAATPALSSSGNNAVADAILKRDWSAVSGESARSVLNALRKLRNKWSISGTTLTVYAEDSTTVAYTQDLTATAGASPITAIAD